MLYGPTKSLNTFEWGDAKRMMVMVGDVCVCVYVQKRKLGVVVVVVRLTSDRKIKAIFL